MEKKNLYLGLVLGIGCISFLVILNAVFYHLTYLKMDVALQNKIETTIETNSTIDFSQVTDFEWDTLYVFTPYASPTEILDKNDILTFNSRFNIEYSDSIVMLGFVKGHYLVDYVELPRYLISNLPTTSIRFSRDTAVFKIHSDKMTDNKNHIHTIAF